MGISVIDTLEVRLRADTSVLTARLKALEKRMNTLRMRADTSLNGFAASSVSSARTQTALARRLGITGRALKTVAANAKKAADGIGLNKLDEINLVGEQAASRRGASGGKSGGSAAESMEGVREALRYAWDKLRRFPYVFAAAGTNLGSFLEKLTGALEKLGGGSVISSAARAGGNLIGAFSDALSSGIPGIRSAAQRAARSASFASGEAKSGARSAGADLTQGFIDGLSSKLSALKNAVSSLAGAAVSRLKSALKIASPSRVTFEAGGFFSQGFAEGILSRADAAEASAQALSRGAVSGLSAYSAQDIRPGGIADSVRAAVNDALGGMSITVPLYVDSMKLGEASIRGINRVTRGAGRVLLEI